MENITNDKILYYPERIAGDYRPITADIFLTNFCNNKCYYCTYNRWGLNDNKKYMSFDEFVKYANILIDMGVKGFILTGGGEPTISPDFEKITSWLNENGIHYGINTNFNNLKLFKPDYLKVSLDGYDRNSYRFTRGVDKYLDVRKNIIDYYEWKIQNSPSTNLGIQFVARDRTDVEKFYEANRDLPVDYISIRPIESTMHKYYDDDASYKKAIECMAKISELKNIDTRVIYNYKWDFLKKFYADCPAAWSQIALDECGNVIYCCHKPFQIIGHITDPDILEKKNATKCDISTCDAPCRLTAPNFWLKKLETDKINKNFI